MITGGSTTVFAEGFPVHKVSDIDTCAHPRATGVFNVLVGGGSRDSVNGQQVVTGLGTTSFST
jgi:hypothetical protein